MKRLAIIAALLLPALAHAQGMAAHHRAAAAAVFAPTDDAIPANLVAWYKMNDDPTSYTPWRITDSSGGNRHLYSAGGSSVRAVYSSGYLSHDGNDFATGALSIAAYPFTVSVWANPSSLPVSAGKACAGVYNTTNTLCAFSARVAAGGTLWAVYARNTTVRSTIGTAAPSTNNWYHVCAVYASQTSRSLYVNGTLDHTTTLDPGNATWPNAAILGALTPSSTLWIGSLDDYRIYNTALASNAVKAVYDGGRK